MSRDICALSSRASSSFILAIISSAGRNLYSEISGPSSSSFGVGLALHIPSVLEEDVNSVEFLGGGTLFRLESGRDFEMGDAD